MSMLHFWQMLWMLLLEQEVVKTSDPIQAEMHKLHFILGLPGLFLRTLLVILTPFWFSFHKLLDQAFHHPFRSANTMPLLSQTELEAIIPETGNTEFGFSKLECQSCEWIQGVCFFLKVLCWRRRALSIRSVCYCGAQVPKQTRRLAMVYEFIFSFGG